MPTRTRASIGCPGPSDVLRLMRKGRGCPGHRREAKLRRLAPGHDEEGVRGRFLHLLLLGKGAERVLQQVSRLPTPSWPGLVPAIHVLLLHKGSKGRGCPGQARARRGDHVLRQRRSAVGIPAPRPRHGRERRRGDSNACPRISLRSSGLRDHALTTADCRVSSTGISTCLFRAWPARARCGGGSSAA